MVVPTYQRSALLRQCIESFDAQTDPPEFEVVAIDDGSRDDTARVLAKLSTDRPWLRWASQSTNRGPAAARNRAIADARGRLLLFVDDDIVAAPSLLRAHVDLHAEASDDLLAILGHVDWHPSLTVSPFMRWLDRTGLQFAYGSWLREGPVATPASAFYTANVSIARRLVDDVGGFDERFTFAAYEDTEFATRLAGRGMHLDYRPAARAFHSRSINLRTFARRMTQVGESAEIMRQISPGFAIDDRRLVSHRTDWAGIVRAGARAAKRRDDESRRAYYWAVVAHSYDRGVRRGRLKTRLGGCSDD